MNNTSQQLLIKLNVDNIINTCITKFGRNKIKDMLKYNLYDNLLLERRQEILIDIIKNEELQNEINDILKSIRELEDIIELWFGDKDLTIEYKFNNKYLNQSIILNIYHKIKSYYPIILIVIYILIYVIFRISGKVNGIKDFFVCIYENYKSYLNNLLNNTINNESISNKIAQIIIIIYLFYQMLFLLNISNEFIINRKHNKKINEYYDKMNQFIEKAENIYDIDIFMKNEKKNIGNIFDKIDDIFIKRQNIGQIISIYKNIPNYKMDMMIIINYIGTLDAFITISKMIGQGYTLPIFIINEKPILYIEKINPQTKINNDLNMEDKQMMIITGPNKSGKSTYINSVLMCILLSQTLGISPCQKIILTPFHKIILSENSENDYYDLIELTKNKNDNIFIGIDNLFNGINTIETSAITYAFIDYINQCKNVISLMTTNNYNINKNSLVKYGKMDVEYDDVLSKYVYSYKILDGIFDKNINIELLAEKRYDNEIIKNVIDKIKKYNIKNKIENNTYW